MRISLKAARVNAGLSQAKASKALGIARATLVNYESGRTRVPASIIKKMVDLYHIEAIFLAY